jgi:hypothetical protein
MKLQRTLNYKESNESISTISLNTGNKIKSNVLDQPRLQLACRKAENDIKLTLTIIVLLARSSPFQSEKEALPFIFSAGCFGGLMALAVVYLLQGKISVISLSISTVILAITADCALHITTHFKHKHSIIDNWTYLIIVCGFATAFEFLTLVFVSSESLHELGILANQRGSSAFSQWLFFRIFGATHTVKDETEKRIT